jgi:hypothetical protein
MPGELWRQKKNGGRVVVGKYDGRVVAGDTSGKMFTEKLWAGDMCPKVFPKELRGNHVLTLNPTM